MKSSHFALIEQFLNDNYKIDGTYTINNDNTVDVDGTVKVKNRELESLTNGLFRFGIITHRFHCINCPNLKSLEGAPKKVGGYFWCDDCKNLMITDQDRKKYKIKG